MISNLSTCLVVGAGLGLVQCLLALPWVVALLPGSIRNWLRQVEFWGVAIGLFLGSSVGLGLILYFIRDTLTLERLGRVYGSLVQAQITADLFVLVFGILLLLWPKGAAVALAAFREGIRQPMFWLIVFLTAFFLCISPIVPYFTFGEDYLMVKELGLDMIMLFTVLFGVMLASISISEEIEGRTAVTLMSKPVSRRQFLLGKFVGILLASLVITGGLGWFFDWILVFKHWWDQVEQSTPLPTEISSILATWLPAGETQAFARAAALWLVEGAETGLGQILGFCQAMVLLALAVSLATRIPRIPNVVACSSIYLLGHLSPVLLQSVQQRQAGSVVSSMLLFMAQLFDMMLPGLALFKPTLITDAPLPLGSFAIYVSEVATYAVVYTSIVLLIGLVLFEDRDLA